MNVGDIVEVNGLPRIVTKVGAGYFQSEPYEKKKPEVEKIVVTSKKGKGKKNDNMA